MFKIADEPTTALFIPVALARQCEIHKVPKGIPCFHSPKSDGYGYYAGVCNHRATRAGLNATVSPQSLSRSAMPRPTTKK